MTRGWSNWSGVLHFEPGEVAEPGDEGEVVDLVRRVRSEGRRLRVTGSAHSSSPLVPTDGVLASLERIAGVFSHDAERCFASVGPGTKLEDLGPALCELGLSLENLGDIDTQTIAGVISTGTHGSGRGFGGISTQMAGARIVNGLGEAVEVREERDPALLHAARVSLGLLGVFTSITLRLIPAVRLVERTWCVPIEECLESLDHLADRHRYLDFYWYPRRDEAKIRARDPEQDAPPAPPGAEAHSGWLHEVIPKVRDLRFNEMEYAVAAERGPDCFREVRERIKQRHRGAVAWRVLYRFIAADEDFLSPSCGRDTVTISLHHNAHLPFREFFDDIEPIFRAYEGRPHWAKIHSLGREELSRLYPMWDEFLAIRERMDPDGVFLNDYLEGLFTGA